MPEVTIEFPIYSNGTLDILMEARKDRYDLISWGVLNEHPKAHSVLVLFNLKKGGSKVYNIGPHSEDIWLIKAYKSNEALRNFLLKHVYKPTGVTTPYNLYSQLEKAFYIRYKLFIDEFVEFLTSFEYEVEVVTWGEEDTELIIKQLSQCNKVEARCEIDFHYENPQIRLYTIMGSKLANDIFHKLIKKTFDVPVRHEYAKSEKDLEPKYESCETFKTWVKIY